MCRAAALTHEVEGSSRRLVGPLWYDEGMSTNKELREKLIDYLQDAHAMEINVQAMLQSMIASTKDGGVKAELERHLEETKTHAERMSSRLDALDEGGSLRKQVTSVMGAGAKGVIDQLRGDKPGKNARDAYVTEALEIAAYELLSRLARRSGDTETVDVCQKSLRDEIRMRSYIENNWDRFLDMTLVEEGIAV